MNGAFIQEQRRLGSDPFPAGQVVKGGSSLWEFPEKSPQVQAPVTLTVKDNVNGASAQYSASMQTPTVMLNVRRNVRTRSQMENVSPGGTPTVTTLSVPLVTAQRGTVDGFEQPQKKVRSFDFSQDLSISPKNPVSYQASTTLLKAQPGKDASFSPMVVAANGITQKQLTVPLSVGSLGGSTQPVVLLKSPPVGRRIISSSSSSTPLVLSSGKTETVTKENEPVFLNESLVPDLPPDSKIDFDDIVFDCIYYYDKYSDVRAACGRSQIRLKDHWNRTGIDEGRMCSPALDLSYFITRIPMELQTRQLNFRTAYKYLSQIIREPDHKQLASSKLYDPVMYVKRYPQLKKYTPLQLMLHYISIGRINKLNASS